MPAPRVTVVGGGVIGSGWAAHFLRMGLDVTAFDPAPEAEDGIRRAVERAWPTLVAARPARWRIA